MPFGCLRCTTSYVPSQCDLQTSDAKWAKPSSCASLSKPAQARGPGLARFYWAHPAEADEKQRILCDSIRIEAATRDQVRCCRASREVQLLSGRCGTGLTAAVAGVVPRLNQTLIRRMFVHSPAAAAWRRGQRCTLRHGRCIYERVRARRGRRCLRQKRRALLSSCRCTCAGAVAMQLDSGVQRWRSRCCMGMRQPPQAASAHISSELASPWANA
jgi:hypothetical protein